MNVSLQNGRKSHVRQDRAQCKGIYMKGLAILGNRKWLKAHRISGVVLTNTPEKETGEAKTVAGCADHTKWSGLFGVSTGMIIFYFILLIYFFLDNGMTSCLSNNRKNGLKRERGEENKTEQDMM